MVKGHRIFLTMLAIGISTSALAQQPIATPSSPPLTTYPQLHEFLKRGIDARSGGIAPVWLLSPEGLRTCLSMAYDLDINNARITAERARLASERQRLEAEAQQLQARSNRPFDTPDEANEHDRRLAENQQQRNDLVPATANFNVLVQRYNQTTTQFTDTCAGKHFYLTDLQSVSGSLPFNINAISAR